MVTAPIARGEVFPVHASNFVFGDMISVVDHPINSRVLYLVAGLVLFSHNAHTFPISGSAHSRIAAVV
jgi:hypothetical protein